MKSITVALALISVLLLPTFGRAQEQTPQNSNPEASTITVPGSVVLEDSVSESVVPEGETPPTETSAKRKRRKRRKTHEGLQGTLWMQTSLEYAVAARQCYNSATAMLPKLLADTTFTAAVEQSRGYKHLPPAIIMDVDETVLSNAAFQARMVKKNASFDEDDWLDWVNEAKATAIPGAVEFIHFARSQGVRVFFVTNRTADGEAATVKNLSSELSMDVSPDYVLCKKEEPNWGSDKTSRRQQIAGGYRVIMLFGDDFNDFAFLGKVPPTQRVHRGMKFANRLGHCWFLLPNPLYGNWDKAIFNYDYSIEDPDVLELKYDLLRTEE